MRYNVDTHHTLALDHFELLQDSLDVFLIILSLFLIRLECGLR